MMDETRSQRNRPACSRTPLMISSTARRLQTTMRPPWICLFGSRNKQAKTIHPSSDGLQPTRTMPSTLAAMASTLVAMASKHEKTWATENHSHEIHPPRNPPNHHFHSTKPLWDAHSTGPRGTRTAKSCARAVRGGMPRGGTRRSGGVGRPEGGRLGCSLALHRLRRTETQVRYDWTWHPPQSHLLRFGTTGGL